MLVAVKAEKVDDDDVVVPVAPAPASPTPATTTTTISQVPPITVKAEKDEKDEKAVVITTEVAALPAPVESETKPNEEKKEIATEGSPCSTAAEENKKPNETPNVPAKIVENIPISEEDEEKKRQEFLVVLTEFHNKANTRLAIPRVGGKGLDLYLLYQEVQRRGGYNAVVQHKQWSDIIRALQLPPSYSSATTLIKNHYINSLLPYENLYVWGIETAPAPAVTSSSHTASAIDLALLERKRTRGEEAAEKLNKAQRLNTEMMTNQFRTVENELLKNMMVDLSHERISVVSSRIELMLKISARISPNFPLLDSIEYIDIVVQQFWTWLGSSDLVSSNWKFPSYLASGGVLISKNSMTDDEYAATLSRAALSFLVILSNIAYTRSSMMLLHEGFALTALELLVPEVHPRLRSIVLTAISHLSSFIDLTVPLWANLPSRIIAILTVEPSEKEISCCFNIVGQLKQLHANRAAILSISRSLLDVLVKIIAVPDNRTVQPALDLLLQMCWFDQSFSWDLEANQNFVSNLLELFMQSKKYTIVRQKIALLLKLISASPGRLPRLEKSEHAVFLAISESDDAFSTKKLGEVMAALAARK